MKNIKNIILAVAVVIIAVIAYLSIAQIGSKRNKGSAPENASATSSDDSNAFATLSNIHYSKTVKDFTEFEITAGSVSYFKDNERSKFDDVEIRFFTRSGNEFLLNAKGGVYDVKKEEISIKGDVVLKSKSGYELKTDSLLYTNGDKIIFTPDAVRLTKDNMVLEGVGMKYDMKKDALTISRDVKVFNNIQ